MIARIRGPGRGSRFVALRSDERVRNRVVWVPIRGGGRSGGEPTRLGALRLCVLDLQSRLGPLIKQANALHALCDKDLSGQPRAEQRRIRALARHVASMLSRAGIDFLRLLDEPVAADDVHLSQKYAGRGSRAYRLDDADAGFPVLLRKARLRHTMRQLDVARLVGVSEEFYGRMERGESQPSMVTLARLHEVLGFDANELLQAVRRKAGLPTDTRS